MGWLAGKPAGETLWEPGWFCFFSVTKQWGLGIDNPMDSGWKTVCFVPAPAVVCVSGKKDGRFRTLSGARIGSNPVFHD